MRDEVGERVGDAHEQRVEALLREHLVEDVGEAPVRLHDLELGRTGGNPLLGEQLETASFRTRYHDTSLDADAASRRAIASS